MRELKDVFVSLCGEAFFEGRKLKKCSSSSHGYSTVYASGRNHLVHRLVAERWLPNPRGCRTVNHKNGCKWDNRVCNLEWATDSENNLHSYSTLGRRPTRGRMKLSDRLASQVLDLKGYMKQSEIAGHYGVKVSLVADIHAGRRKIEEWECSR